MSFGHLSNQGFNRPFDSAQDSPGRKVSRRILAFPCVFVSWRLSSYSKINYFPLPKIKNMLADSRVMALIAILIIPSLLVAQKRMISLPFEFEKGRQAASEHDAFFLSNDADSNFALILKDNKKAGYVLLDKNFKIVSKIDADIKSTVFKEDITDYRGGATNGSLFHFIYEDKDRKSGTNFKLETVDFKSKSIIHTSLFQIPKDEKVLSSFSDNNFYFTLTADDKAGELVLYSVNHLAVFKQQRIPFTIPANAGKKRDKVSEYLSNLEVMKTSEEPDLSAAVSTAKIFSSPGKLDLVINEEDHPVHLFSLQTADFKMEEKFIDFKNFSSGSKEKLYINSFIKNGKLFSLVLNKKSIRIAVHDIVSSKLLNQYEINEETNYGTFASFPVSERRMGKKSEEKDVDDIKKLIKALERGTEGIMITENKKGQLIVTIGTYNLVPISTGGSGGSYSGPDLVRSSIPTTPGISNNGATRSAITYYNNKQYWRPGTPSYTTTSARYYVTTYFKLLMDPTGSKIEKGRANMPVADQIKDYMEGVDPKARATNQFNIGERQFYGFYDRDAAAYVVEEIRIRK